VSLKQDPCTEEPKEKNQAGKKKQTSGPQEARSQLQRTRGRSRAVKSVLKTVSQTGLTAQVLNFDALWALQSVQSFVGKAELKPQAEPSQGIRYSKSLSVPKATQIIAVWNMAHLLQREAFYLRRVSAQVC
jgi:hypothetical protein